MSCVCQCGDTITTAVRPLNVRPVRCSAGPSMPGSSAHFGEPCEMNREGARFMAAPESMGPDALAAPGSGGWRNGGLHRAVATADAHGIEAERTGPAGRQHEEAAGNSHVFPEKDGLVGIA